MPLEYQRGSVFVKGKRRKTWFGKYRVWRIDPETNTWVTKQRTKKIGLKADLTRFEAEEKLRGMIAADNSHAQSPEIAHEDSTLEWFVINRHLPMMSSRETTKKKTAYEIKR